MKEIAIDALVIGGGVQGLMLLRDLRTRGYSVLLLEIDKFGGGQTCHSHVLIHQGHLCRKPSLAAEFRQGFDLWQTFLASNPAGPGSMEVLLAFDDEVDAIEQQSIWKFVAPSVQCKWRHVPTDFGASRLKRAFAVHVLAPTSEEIVETLLEGLTAHTAKIDAVEDFQMQDRNIQQVTISGGTRALVRPRAVVLAAGAGNQALLDRLSERAFCSQRNRHDPVLIIGGEQDLELPCLGGFFVIRGNGISIAPRHYHDRVVWLVSDSRVLVSGREQPLGGWFRSLYGDLQDLAPALFRHPDSWRWGLQTAARAEGWVAHGWPYSGRIEQFGIDNLWTVWPTFLTLAPLLSRRVCDGIARRRGSDGGTQSAVEPFWQAPEPSKEYWKHNSKPEQLQSWSQFSLRLGPDGHFETPEGDDVYGS